MSQMSWKHTKKMNNEETTENLDEFYDKKNWYNRWIVWLVAGKSYIIILEHNENFVVLLLGCEWNQKFFLVDWMLKEIFKA